MRGQFGHQTQVVTFAANSKESSAFDISGVNRVAFEIPTFASNLATATANIFVQVCQSAEGTFRRLQDMGVYSAASGLLDWEVPSMTGNKTILCRPIVGFNHGKLELSQTATAGFSATVHKLY